MPCCQRRQLNSQGEDWQNLFRHYDEDGDGYIPIDDLKKMVRESAREFELSTDQVDELLYNADNNKDGEVDFTEFCLLMTRAKRMRMRRVMIYVGRSILPARLQSENSRYLLEYDCLPPPLFIVLISLAQLAWWLVDCLVLMPSAYGDRCQGDKCKITATGPINTESPLVLDPYKMHEAWRFVSYSFCHFGTSRTRLAEAHRRARNAL
ncbi:rhomboid family protein [Aphelenchoides avenae]|nr:rhomboid family protein [Aphelenchus avenae]